MANTTKTHELFQSIPFPQSSSFLVRTYDIFRVAELDAMYARVMGRALMGRTLVGWALMGQTLMGRLGPLWGGPSWAGPLWARP